MEDKNFPVVRQHSFKGRIGVAQIDITPPVGIYSRYWGAAKHDVAVGIHQPLTVTCMTFQEAKEEKPMVLMAIDLGVMGNHDDELSFRNKLLENFGLPAANLMICCTHSHATARVSRADADKSGGEFIEDYVTSLQRSAIRAIETATASAATATLTWQYGRCSLATNRDLPMKDDDDFVVGFNPAVAADDTLLVGRVTDQQDRVIGTIVNYACHPTSLAWDNRLISPDYVGATRALIEAHTRAPCLFLQGASGELSPAEQYSGDTSIAEKNGRRLGYAAMAVLEEMLPPGRELYYHGIVESGAALAVWKQRPYNVSEGLAAELVEVPFNLKPLPSLKEIDKQYQQCKDRVARERLFRKRNIRRALGDGDTVDMPLWVWKLGDSLLFGQPNEAYSELQIELRRAFAHKAVAVMNLVNGGMGYLPPRRFYTKNIYQEWQTPFSAGSLETLISFAKDAAGGLCDQSTS